MRREKKDEGCNLDHQDSTKNREDDRQASSIHLHACGTRINSTDVTSRIGTIALPARGFSTRVTREIYSRDIPKIQVRIRILERDSPLRDILSHRIFNQLFIYLSQCEIHKVSHERRDKKNSSFHKQCLL